MTEHAGIGADGGAPSSGTVARLQQWLRRFRGRVRPRAWRGLEPPGPSEGRPAALERPQHDEALQLRRFFDAAPQLMGVIELAGEVDLLHLRDNPAAAAFFGTTPEAMRGRLASQLGVPRAHAELWIEHCRRSQSSGRSVEFEYEHHGPRGARQLAALVTHVGGDPLRPRFSYVVRDVTERRKTEAALRALAETRAMGLEFLQFLAAQMAAVVGTDLAFISKLKDLASGQVELLAMWDRGALQPVFEYSIRGTPCEHVVARELAFFPSGLQQLFPNDAWLREVGVESYFAIPLFDSHGRPLGHIGVMDRKPCDVGPRAVALLRAMAVRAGTEVERLHAEAVLRETASLLSSTLEANGDGILVVDLQDRKVTCNQRCAQIWRTPPELIAAGDARAIFAHVLAQLKDKQAFQERLADLRADPECEATDVLELSDGRVLERYTAPQRAEGMVVGRVFCFRDVTQQRQAERSLRQAETMAQLGGMVAGLAHEVRNPLFAISAAVDAFEARVGPQREHQPLLVVLRQQVERMNGFMNELLEYGRPAPLALAPDAIQSVVAEAIRACSLRASGAGVTLQSRVAPGLAPVNMDRRRLQQVFQNLLDNAIQHSPLEGTVLIEVREARDAGRAFVDCAVLDSGSGFRKEDLPRIFEPFFTRRRGGTGLGLSIVQRIVKEHGGTVLAENRPDGGGAVRVRLPADS